MKSLIGALLIALGMNAFAEISDLRSLPVKEVLDVYEIYQEPSSDQEWIHQFETTSLGEEMQHMVELKKPQINKELK